MQLWSGAPPWGGVLLWGAWRLPGRPAPLALNHPPTHPPTPAPPRPLQAKYAKSGAMCIARISVEKPICIEAFDHVPQVGGGGGC